MKIEIFYFDHCPSYRQTVDNLREVLKEENIQADLCLIRVTSPENAEEVSFMGSPTIKIDGIDLDGLEGPASFNCRLYRIDGRLTGIPTTSFIREKIKMRRS